MLDAPIFSRRSDGLDLLRAVLALWVVFAHLVPWSDVVGPSVSAPLPLLWTMRTLGAVFQSAGETHPAVLGFIVLSGYCIHRNGFRRRGGDLGGYAIRRAFRIYPVYVLATLVGIALFILSASISPTVAGVLAGTAEITGACTAVKLVGLSAIFPSFHECAFQGNAPLATVMVEMWLYGIYPLLVSLILRQRSERWLWALLALVWLAGVVAMTHRPWLKGWWHNGSLAGFLLYWWIGAKFLDPTFIRTTYRWRWALVAAWVALTIALIVIHVQAPIVVEARKLFLALLFGLAIVHIDDRQAALASSIAVLGRAGYSLYAFHAPLLYASLLLGAPWWLALALVLTVGTAMFYAIEQPFIRLGRRLSRTAAVATQG
jgi:peptidoglycan/LPS O-acetylase OafA/YrhL